MDGHFESSMYMDRPVPHPRSVAALGFALIALHDGWWRGERLGSVGVIACEVIVQGGACCVNAHERSEVRAGEGSDREAAFHTIEENYNSAVCVV
jgi:hypothetical protein